MEQEDGGPCLAKRAELLFLKDTWCVYMQFVICLKKYEKKESTVREYFSCTQWDNPKETQCNIF